MIDLHFHCLPFIDDGPGAWDEAVALVQRAAGEGTTAVVATPHVLRDPWLNPDPAAREELRAELERRSGMTILPGCEYWFGRDAVELWEEGRTLTLLGSGRHLLMEFPASSVPKEAEAVIHELVLVGVSPLIAHPERNLELARNPARLQRLVEMGASTQVTAGALLGEFGTWPHEAALRFHELGLITLVASDAHDLARRPPRLRAAREWVTQEWGEEEAERLFEVNPRTVAGMSEGR